MKIVVGLGNPGRQYEQTRHNVGWMVLDRLAERAGLDGRQKARDTAAITRGRYLDLDLALVKPTTYMNLSGLAVRKVLARERTPLDDMLVVVDDFSLPLGRLRLRGEGSAGGHNGLRSIIDEMGTQRFARLRVGIGEPARSAIDHVLSRFAPDERERLHLVLDAAADAVETWAIDGASRAANRWNSWAIPEPAATAAEAAGSAPLGSIAPGALVSESPSEDARGAPGPDGIVRTRTGWRRLLPRQDRDAGR